MQSGKTAMPRIVKADMENILEREFEVKNPDVEGYRLDVYLTKRLPKYSRTLIQKLIRDGMVTVNGRASKPSYEVRERDKLVARIPTLIEPQMIAENIPLNIVYEDEHIVVINKPAGMVVHPAAGHWAGTLANALLGHCGSMACRDGDIYKPGIVHRLDKETSGVILAAKTAEANAHVSNQFQKRTVQKQYLAIVHGEPRFDSDIIDKPLGHDKNDRLKMSVRKDIGKEASSVYEVMERFSGYALVRVMPKTGRTHQIRVHLASIGHIIVGDSTYGGRDAVFERNLAGDEPPPLPPRRYGLLVPDVVDDAELSEDEAADPLEDASGPKPAYGGPEPPIICRQALHAFRLTITHPATGKPMTFEAEMADDMKRLVEALRENRPPKS
jgi:23S rRNA pseudouridine1911/1915/1917 synthase